MARPKEKQEKAGTKKKQKAEVKAKKAKAATPRRPAPALPGPDDFVDRPLTEDDRSWVNQNQAHLLFLTDLSTDDLAPQTKKSRMQKVQEAQRKKNERMRERETPDEQDSEAEEGDSEEEGIEDGEGTSSKPAASKAQPAQSEEKPKKAKKAKVDSSDEEESSRGQSLEDRYAKSLPSRADLKPTDVVERLPVKTDKGELVRRVEDKNEEAEALKLQKKQDREQEKAKAKQMGGEKKFIEKTHYDVKGNVIPERKKRPREAEQATATEAAPVTNRRGRGKEEAESGSDDDQEGVGEDGPKSKRQRKDRVNFRTASYDEVKSDTALRIRRQEYLKQKIASAATEVLTDPMQNIESLAIVQRLCEDGDLQLAKMSIISAMTLFKDIIPAYRIRLEAGEKLSKEIKALRFYEENLLKTYQLFLAFLYKHVVENKHSELRLVSIRCMCELLVHAPHFNFRTNILLAITRNMNSSNSEISEICYNCMCDMFAADSTNFEASLEAVETLTKYICDHGYDVHSRMIDCFVTLKLDHVLQDVVVPKSYSFTEKLKAAKNKIKKPHMNNKMRHAGEDDEENEIKRELAAADATPSDNERKERQISILRNIIVCYVRLLKNKPDSSLLYCSLAGLAKFAHLMNIELLYDLLSYLRVVISMEGLPATTLLQCIVTVQNLLSGHGEALDVDIKEFYSHLYRVIPVTLITSYSERDMRLLIDALYTMLLRPKSLPVQRVAAFVKRMLTYATFTHSHTASALIEISRILCRRYRSLEQLFSAESSGLGSYKADADDPDHVNPFSASLWEYTALSQHYQPHVAKLANDELVAFGDASKPTIGYSYSSATTNRTLSKMRTREDMQQVLDKFNPFAAVCNPPVQPPPDNPLRALQLKINKKLFKASTRTRRNIKKHVFIKEIQLESKFMKDIKSALHAIEQPQAAAAAAATTTATNGSSATPVAAVNGTTTNGNATSKKKKKKTPAKKKSTIVST